MVEVASTKPAPPWLTDFCADYAPTMLSLAQLFIWTGLLFALVSAMAEALLTIRQSKGGITPAGEPPSLGAGGGGFHPACSRAIA
jgi:hypothetical protein